MKKNRVTIFILATNFFICSIASYAQNETINIDSFGTGGVVPTGVPSGWVSNTQLPNKPNEVPLVQMVGINLKKGDYNAITKPYFNKVANNLRFFHQQEDDYAMTISDNGSATFDFNTVNGVPSNSLPDACVSNLGAFTGNIVCDGGGYKSMLNHFQLYYDFYNSSGKKPIYSAWQTFNFPRSHQRSLGDFPDYQFTAEQWGGSYNDVTKTYNTGSIRSNAKTYTKAFAKTFCPDAEHCLVKVLEVGNEPWGEPGWVGYREIFKGVCDGLEELYGTSDINQWPMKISVGAMQYFQDVTFEINKTQRGKTNANGQLVNASGLPVRSAGGAGVAIDGKNSYGSDYAGYMIPKGFEKYLYALNSHQYSAHNVAYTSGGKTYYKEENFSYITLHPEDPLSSFQKIKNMALWKYSGAFPNMKEANVTEFGWNSESKAITKYFPPSAANQNCNCNSPLKSITGGAHWSSTISDISTDNSGTDWLYYAGMNNGKLQPKSVGEKAQAAYLIRSYLLLARWGITKGFVYESLDEITNAGYHHTGILGKTVPTNTNLYEGTNFNRAVISGPKKAYYAFSKLHQYLGKTTATSSTTLAAETIATEKHFLLALKEDTQGYIYLMGESLGNGNYRPTEVIAWSPTNINDGEQLTIIGDGYDDFGQPGKIGTRNKSENNEYVDFTNNHQENKLMASLAVGLGDLSSMTINTSKDAFYLDWNTTDYTGTWKDTTPMKQVSSIASVNDATKSLTISTLTSIPVVLPILVNDGCYIDVQGVAHNCLAGTTSPPPCSEPIKCLPINHRVNN